MESGALCRHAPENRTQSKLMPSTHPGRKAQDRQKANGTGTPTAKPKRSDMTARHSDATKRERHLPFVLPDPPEREPEDMTSFDHLTLSGGVHHLVQHLGNADTTIVAGERYITREPGAPAVDRMAPDLLIAFNADPEAYRSDNGYIISVQGKPPDFVMEIASRRTGRRDVVQKRSRYAALGISEYWRFDETGQLHGTRLAGDRLVDSRYEPIPIETVEDGILQGYSSVLNLLIRWEHGELRWHDSETGQHIIRYSDLQDRAESEREARIAAEDRIRDLEAELHHRRQP